MSSSLAYVPIENILVYSFGSHKAILMLKAFFDESGAFHDSEYVCMAGGLASLESWTKLEKEWVAVLREFNLEWFHMTDFESNHDQFKGWDAYPEKHRTLLASLVHIIRENVEIYIGTSENTFEHKLVTNPQKKDNPYFNCLLTCIDCAAQHASAQGPNEKVEMIFADHPEFGRQVRYLYPQVKEVGGFYKALGPDAYASPKDVIPLQAADLIAFEFRKEIERRGGKRPGREMRWPLRQFKDKPWCNRGYFDFDIWPTQP